MIRAHSVRLVALALFGAVCGGAQGFAATCESIPILSKPGQDPLLSDFLKGLDGLEKSFLQNDVSTFLPILHPAIVRDPPERREIFTGTVLRFGLTDMSGMMRTLLFKLDFGDEKITLAECPFGAVRGVVGPKVQLGAIHTLRTKHEQVRLFTLFAPIPEGQRAAHKSALSVGLVHMHAQVWTQEQKSPTVLLDEARKWRQLNEPLAAWILAEASRRLLVANPYLELRDGDAAMSMVQELEKQRPPVAEIQKQIEPANKEKWTFEGFSVAFSGTGIEPLVKFRLPKIDPDLSAVTSRCRDLVVAMSSRFQGMKSRFRGVECLPYQPGENLSSAPGTGTRFVSWEEMGK